MTFFWRSIRLKLTVATLVPLLTAIIICWVIGASTITTRFSSQALQTVAANLNSAHEIFIAEQSRLSDTIRLTGQSPELGASLYEATPERVLPMLQTVLRNERLSFLTVVDRFGFVRCRAANPSGGGDPRADDALVASALKGAMVSGGTLAVTALFDREKEHCAVTIGDSGSGITAEVVEKLFTPFFTTKPRGIGLGLAVSYGIVTDHGGDIRVESEPGRGAAFTVVLPLRQPIILKKAVIHEGHE
jgi:sensor histidine kinase regulating citrate/malate metabolism